MDSIVVTGGNRLNGVIPISGAKNATLPLMIASLLSPEPLILENVPHLADVESLVRILTNHGVDYRVEGKRKQPNGCDGRTIHFSAEEIVDTTAPYELVSKMRASFWVIGPLLARMHKATVSYTFPKVSVGATHVALMAATLAKGTTVLENAAREPEVTDLANCLVGMNGAALKPVDVSTDPFPGFPTDLQAQFMGLMTMADGVSKIQETIFENRFMHVQELARLGADITVDGNTATVTGVKELTGAQVMATDLRASVSLVIAGLVAQGDTTVSRVYHLDRGFDRLEEKLSNCGAVIERVSG